MSELNILVSVNRAYLKYLSVLIYSITENNPKQKINIYIANQDLVKKDYLKLKKIKFPNQPHFIDIKISSADIKGLPVTEKRYPIEIYFRFIALKYLPLSLDRILYLDTDTIVINSLSSLYDMDFEDNLFIACTHIKQITHKFNEVRLNMHKDNAYINSGIMLMNLQKIHKLNISSEIFNYALKNKKRLMLPDQDIISTLYGDQIKLVDSLVFNLGERTLKNYNISNFPNKKDLNWVRKNTIIIHYFGRNKPWKPNYIGKLNIFYQEYYERLNALSS